MHAAPFSERIHLLLMQRTLDEQDDPRDGHVKEPHRIDSQSFSVCRHKFRHEPHRSPRCPGEPDNHKHNLEQAQGAWSKGTRKCRDVQGKDAIPKDAHRLEERYFPPQQQRVGCHHAGPHPDDHVHQRENHLLLVLGLEPENDGEGQTEKERTPEVPLLQTRPSLCAGTGEHHIPEFLSDPPEISHDRLRHGFIQSPVSSSSNAPPVL
mmetsp:Transcript_20584/g.41138  ORF Transcript_20584/g.41138 Transcript_20584/m.41138 type:complete len:208 (+) Transcript_20584:137-760(+)